jgi:hypothetical protein
MYRCVYHVFVCTCVPIVCVDNACSLGKLLKHNGIRGSLLNSNSADADPDDRLESLIDANDQLTERVVSRISD